MSLLNIKNARVYFGNVRLDVKIAGTFWRKMRGLMGVKSMAENEGMIFMFKREARRSFWMAGVLIPLDIIWMNGKMEIVEITKNQQPCKTFFCSAITPKHKSKYVLEVNAGVADKLNLKVGERATLLP